MGFAIEPRDPVNARQEVSCLKERIDLRRGGR